MNSQMEKDKTKIAHSKFLYKFHISVLDNYHHVNFDVKSRFIGCILDTSNVKFKRAHYAHVMYYIGNISSLLLARIY